MASPRVVGFVGLDELSVEMAALLIKSGFQVKAFAAAESAWLTPFLEVGGSQCHNISESGKDVTALIVTSVDQVDDELFCGNQGITKWMCEDAAVLIRSTMPLRCIQKLEKHLNGEGTRVIVGLHVFKGVSDAFGGKIMVTAVGRLEETKKVEPLLAEMSDKLYVLDGEVSAASKVRMVTELLKTIHFAASLEAMFLGVAARIHPWILYDIISNAAGSSRVFVDVVPKLLKGDNSLQSPLISLLNNVGAVMDAAKELTFPLPLLAIARQQLIRGYSCKVGDHASDKLVEIWEKYFGVNIRDVASNESYSPTDLAEQIVGSSISVKRIGFLGLGAMGFGMAAHLLISNFCVLGYDIYEPSMSRFTKVGGLVGHSPAEVSKDVDVLIIMVANEAQAESVLFGDGGSVSALPAGSSIILSSTVSPGYVTQLEQRLKGENKNLKLVDAPVSGGVKRAADGTLTIMASGTKEALEHAGSVLSALSEKLYVINGGCGAASSVKMVNQLLAGVHIAAASEAMAFGAKVGLDTRMLFDIITHSEGNSWMFANRVPHMLDNDYTPYSAVDIFVKDLGIVNKEGSVLAVPLHLSAVAHQQFVSGSASGWGRLDDAAVVKVYEKLTGVAVEGKHAILKKENIFNSLPPEWSVDPVEGIQMLAGQNASKVLIVLDDDPTGTQTVHGIEVLTEWSIDSLAEQLSKRPSCFFILTNSRSLSSEKAYALIQEICKNISTAAKLAGNIGFSVVLRGDSTLRGHFPEEADAAVSVLGEMDAWVICPFFLQGGRYTINDIHYVADSDSLVPAGNTEFSKDAAFGYKASNLCEWVEEKTRGRIRANRVASIPIQLLRRGGPSAVCEHLCNLPKGSTCIVNAASERDVAVFALGMMQAEIRGKSFLCRTAASFVSARIGIKPKPPISPDNLSTDWKRIGGLIVVGSYVPKTTKQIEGLKTQLGHVIKCIEVSVDNVSMKPSEVREEEISHAAETADVFLKLGKDTLLMTSRDLIKGKSPSESLEINFKVSSALVEIVRRIKTRPRYILAKGGITSSDLATKAMEARQAMVVGQALPGVPLWELGPGSRHPGIPYIVFPGNVGDSNALAEVVQKWSYPHRSFSTKDLLNNAEKGGYAVGAFNVYNLEGVEAVFAAAEAERSPAILQVHPGALKVGGHPLIACCVSAAQRASVPITVHFDHGSSQKELVEVLELGFNSVMVDGSHLPFKQNISFTRYLSTLAHSKNITVEAELGRLSGTEDDLTVEDYEARLTDLNQAEEFIDETGIDALAVCIGNVHGTYPASGPNLRLDLLKELHQLASKKGVVLVLHGASGLPKELIKECIVRGIRKFNVNTEVRNAYLESLRENNKDLVHIMSSAKEAMKAVIAEKMHLFGSAGRA